MERPAYSSDVTPSDYRLFSTPKQNLADHKLKNIVRMKQL
jgi:hypothetical protein